ncbi:MAG: hypothetical protein J0L82_13065 [Deltaproteobacteria bacterium]|nr:hypothetical protein [Deltaproteobacteria bacterium]
MVHFLRLSTIVLSSVLALTVFATPGAANEVDAGISAKPYSVVLKTPILIDSLTSRSVCGKTLDGKTRLCAGSDSRSQYSGDSVSKLKSFVAGGPHFCGVDERGVRCWQTEGEFEKPIQKILESGLYDRARFSSERVCVPQKDLTIHCYQPELQRWELVPGGNRYVSYRPPMETYGPYSDLRDFQILDNELCALDGDAINCTPFKNIEPDLPVTPRVVFPRGPFRGARQITGQWNSLCVLSDAGLSCSHGRELADAKYFSLGNEWTKATQLSTFGYDGYCAHSESEQPLCVRYDSIKDTVTDAVPEDYKKPGLRIKKFGVDNDRLCALTENVATGESEFSCLIYSSVTEIPFMKDVVDFKVTSESVCGIDRAHRVHCVTNNYHRPSPLPEDGSEIRSAGSCRWNDTRFHCSDLNTDTNFSDIRKVISASKTEGDDHPCIIFENQGGVRSVRCFGSQEALGSQASVLEPEMDKIVATSGSICLYGGQNIACWGMPIGGEPMPNLSSVQKVLFSREFACAKDQFGFLCWGWDLESRKLLVPQSLGDIDSIQDFALGDSHICVLTRDNQVQCWGSNSSGQLDVPNLTNPISIAVSGNTTCASSDEGVTCWGQREDSLNQ